MPSKNDVPFLFIVLALVLACSYVKAQHPVFETEQNNLPLRELHDRKEAIANSPSAEERGQLQQSLQTWLRQQENNAIRRSLAFHMSESSKGTSDWLWFWTNHFSVFSKKTNMQPMLANYEDTARRYSLNGSFEELLRNMVLHPAMLVYLDNLQNRKDRHNENLAREILELHTVGINGGYEQRDIQALAQALSGIVVWTQSREPNFECLPPKCRIIHQAGSVLLSRQHTGGAKLFMGKIYRNAEGLEIFEMLRDLAHHPKTIGRLAAKLIQFAIQDHPSDRQIAIVREVWQRTAGDLSHIRKSVEDLRTLESSEKRLKDPFRHLRDISHLLDQTCSPEVRMSAELMQQALERLGMGQFQRISPDGYPVHADYWLGPDTLLQRLETSQMIVRQLSQNLERDRMPLRLCTERLRLTAHSRTRKAIDVLESNPEKWLTVFLVSPEIMFH